MQPKKKKKKVTTSKLLLFCVMVSYFIAFGIGSTLVIIGTGDLYAYLAFVGAPTATAIAYYLWKAKNENMNKYKAGEENHEADYGDAAGEDGFEEEETGDRPIY